MSFLKKTLTLSLFFIEITLCFNAQADSHTQNSTLTHQKAEQAMSEGNFAISYCLWEPLAQKGDSKAQFNIGWMYHNGYGLAIDDELAFKWWIKAAEFGYTDAYYALADLYLAGFGVKKDPDAAMGWYIAAAQRHHEASLEVIHDLPLAQNKLGKKYLKILLEEDPFLLGNTYQVKVAKANVRTGPGKQFKIIKTLKQGDLMVPLTTQGNWTQVGLFYTAQTVWIFSKLIEKSTLPFGRKSKPNNLN